MNTKEQAACSQQRELRELQTETLPYVLGALAVVASYAIIDNPTSMVDLRQEKLLGGLLLLVLGITWRLLGHSYRLAVWLLVLGVGGVTLRLLYWYPAIHAEGLLVLPVILALAYLGNGAGAITGLGASLLLLLRTDRGVAGLADGSLVAALGTIWGAAGLIGLALSPLRTVMTWSWYNYERAHQLLEQSRDRQVELHAVCRDLQNAYRELTRLNQLVIASHKAAEDARRAKEAFVANVSHELRTPLNMIIGFSELITQAPRVYRQGLPRELLADVAAIQRNAEHLSRLVDDVLDLSKAEAGAMSLALSRCSVSSLIAQAAEAVRALFDSKGLYLQVEVPEDLPDVLCDATRIRQVLLNLLSNAARFTERGGVRIVARQQDAELIVGVSDTGPGIPEKARPRLFEPFHQLESPYQDRHGGSGLGLSICKKLVELHHGRMWLESDTGIGTTFLFSLPVETTTGLQQAATRWVNPYWDYRAHMQPRAAPVPDVMPRIVFVDAEASLSSVARREFVNTEIVAVSDIDAAVAVLRSAPAQALVVNEEGIDDLASWRTALAELPFTLPIISCSVPGVRAAARRLGVLRCLVKPVTREALLEAVDGAPQPVRSILVVDDEPEALQLFTRMLASSGRGYSLLRATDGHRALEIARAARPDLLLLDLIMPGMDGFGVLAQVHQDPALADLPVITISAQDPTPEPTPSDGLRLSRLGGLSARDVLQAVRVLAETLGPAYRTAYPTPAGTPGD